ncbi:hypothetical protein ACIL20_004237 [Vibrio vulnificus]
MQDTITFIMHGQGLKNQNVANIILAGYTADPLRTLLESLTNEVTELSSNEKKIVKNIFTRIQKITSVRNDIVHSTWFIGYGNSTTTDFSETSGLKLHKNRNGADFKSFKYVAEDYSVFTDEADKLQSLVRRLNGCLIVGSKIENNFKFNDDKEVIAFSEKS